MGSQLFREVAAMSMNHDERMKGLTTRSRLVLFAMAFNAHDTGTDSTDARCYFGGWEHLATHYLGYHGGDDTPGEQAVTRAIRELTQRGLITQVGRKHRRGNRVYELHLLFPTSTKRDNEVGKR